MTMMTMVGGLVGGQMYVMWRLSESDATVPVCAPVSDGSARWLVWLSVACVVCVDDGARPSNRSG
jgi:hypothetical protein